MAYEIVVHELAIGELESLRAFEKHLDSILTRAQSERIVISRRGKPCAVLVGIEDYDAEDLELARSQDFWRMIRRRRASGKSLPLAEVEARLGSTSGKPAGKRAATRKGRKNT
ncbi:MAG: type II toxin-antitoxin system Phd/YefM family antitoxin [Isosphaeraceae bacterium]